MEKLVSIIIPFKDESKATVDTALASINNQIGIDFDQVEVVVVSDGGLRFDEEQLNDEFGHLNIRYYRYAESHGAGMARQVGMDISESKYVMFMDADDQLYFVGALLEFFNVVKYHGDHQIMIGKYLEQGRNGDNDFRYYMHENNDWKSPVAKWFNREYLAQIQLTWAEDIKVFEDTYFVGVACMLANDIYQINTTIYMWLWNGDSTTRTNGGQSFYRQLDQWVKSYQHTFEKLAEFKPNLLIEEFLNYEADLYLRKQKWPAEDEAEFWRCQGELLLKFPQQFLQVKDQVASRVEQLVKSHSEYGQFNAAGVPAFIETQDRVLDNLGR